MPSVIMECSFCHKVFHKGEHLRRHERSHTGARPFVCKHCKRPFSRQDSLLRHERLHARLENAKSPQSQSAPGPITPESLSTAEVDAESHASPYVTAPAQTSDHMNGAFPQSNAASTELGFELIWPDSEYLFQTIMSPNTLAFPSEAPPSELSVGTPSSTFDERVPSIDAIPSGGNHKAVHDVSQTIASWSSSVTAAAESNSIHSVFLDECLHMFFVRFVPTFPVLHRATFVFRDCIHPLLLNAIAIGSLYLGPKDAVTKGEVLWRLAHTAVSTTWQSLINHRGPFDACQGVQLVITALLGQVYGSLSKNRIIRTMSQSFHGLGFTWANFIGMFDSEPYAMENLPQSNASNAEKDHQWRSWVAREIQHRALLAHYMLDGLIAQMSGKATTIRHTSNQLTLLANEAAFAAGTAGEWLSLLRGQPATQPTFRSVFHLLFSPLNDSRWLSYSYSALSLRVLLEGVQSLLSDCDENGEAAVGLPSKNEIRRSLARIYETISQGLSLSPAERLETLLRWHVISLDAIANTPLLGKSICRRYSIEQHIWANAKGVRPGPDLSTWANTPDARRAMLHAVSIQDIVEQLPRGRAHAIHFPSSLFAAATVYTLYLLAGQVTVRLPSTVDWADVVYPANDPCVALAELAGSAFGSDTSRYIRGEPMSSDLGATTSGAVAIRNLLYEFNSIQKLFGCLNTQWGIAGDMESVVDDWITICH